jgi:hypothetical protein
VEILNALLLAWSLVPLVAMILALGYASWLREGRRESAATALSHHRDES